MGMYVFQCANLDCVRWGKPTERRMSYAEKQAGGHACTECGAVLDSIIAMPQPGRVDGVAANQMGAIVNGREVPGNFGCRPKKLKGLN